MATLEETLKNNPYKDIITPLISAYGRAGKYAPNPHEVILASWMLKNRIEHWGGNIPILGKEDADNRMIGIKGAAKGDRAADPETALISNLEQKLRGLNMSLPNAWINWNEAVNAFFNSLAPVLNHFIYKYKNGAYASYYKELIGAFDHPDGNDFGLELYLGEQGEDLSIPAQTTVTTDTYADPADYQKYFTVYRTPTERAIVWFARTDVISPVLPPAVPPIGGVNDTYVQVGIAFSGDENKDTTIAQKIIDGLNTIGGFTGASRVDNVVTISADESIVPASDFVNAITGGAWAYAFVLGSAGASTTSTFSLSLAPYGGKEDAANNLTDRFFIIYDTAGLSTMFYYNVDGAGTFIPPIITDSLVAIDITTGDSAADILTITDTALVTTGLVTTTVVGLKLNVEYILTGPVTELNTGTATIGVNYEFNDELVASDLSVLATGITSKEEYCEAWNTLRVPYEATLGNTYPYLNPNINGAGDPLSAEGGGCGVCFRRTGKPVYGGEPGDVSNDNPNGPTGCVGCGGNQKGSVMATSAYPTYPLASFNTPGNIFIASEGRQSQLIPLSQIV